MSEPDSSPPNPPDWQHVKWYKPPEKVKAETSADEAESYGALAILFALVLGGAALVSPYVLAFIFGGGGGRHYSQNHGFDLLEWFAEHDGKMFALLRLAMGAGIGVALAFAALWAARRRKD